LPAARPFAISAEHVAQVLARHHAPASSPDRSHASYVTELLERAERGEVTDAYWRMVSELEPELFAQAIQRAAGNQAKAARWLGITRLKMREKLAELGLRSEEPGTRK
jgi:DNA-binding protein Fis